MPDDWSREEVEAAVADYLDMLLMDVQGEEFNKAERNRRLQRLLNNRSRGSVEWKHQNISAILRELSVPYVRGYKPRHNYQELLREVVEERLADAPDLLEAIDRVVNQPVQAPPTVEDILSVLVAPPEREDGLVRLQTSPPRRNSVKRNYLKTEAENRSLGVAGEEFVLQYEHARLWRAGKRRLAEQVEHVAKTQGDGLGYDILSFEASGQERLIEVKTTRFGEFTPFFASRNEVDVSENKQTEYQLYRLYSFRREPKLYVLPGSLARTCTLDPFQFIALPQSAAYSKKARS
jgi:hypothetical protein